jgi:hypothetical protein
MINGDAGLFWERLAVVLGFTNLALFIGMGITCRSFLNIARNLRITRFTSSRPYQALFKYHSFFWYGFFVVLFLHIILAILHTEIPKAGDPDAAIHWAILGFAGSVLVSTALTFSGCRTFSGILQGFRGDKLYKGFYGHYFKLHAYFWVILLAALAGHLVTAYPHIGFWPHPMPM